MKDVSNDERFENVELEVATHTTDAYCCVVADNLSAHHGHCFTLSWVYFTGHDGRAGLVFGKRKLAETTSRSRTQKADVIGNLHHSNGESINSTMQVYKSIFGGK